MKSLFFIGLSLLLSNVAAAKCNTPETEAMFKNFTSIDGRVVSWKSVRKGTFKKNRLFPITILPKERIRLTEMIYKGDAYFLTDSDICFDGSTLTVTGINRRKKVRSFKVRRANDSQGAIVRLEDLQFGFKIYLRPSRLVD